MKGVILLSLFVAVFRAKAWTPSVKNPFEFMDTPDIVHTVSDCMHVTSEEGDYHYKKIPHFVTTSTGGKSSSQLNDVPVKLIAPAMSVCGLYVVAGPDQLVEMTIKDMDVSCDSGGLMGFVDGWELNGQYFPGIKDHQLPLEKRIIEFCNEHNHWPMRMIRRSFRSNQNAALLQYRIPIRGSFLINVRFLTNPEPCNIMAEGLAPVYTIKSNGHHRNCTITALFPAVVAVDSASVGQLSNEVSYDCDENQLDRLEVGGSGGLDSHEMEKSSVICGHSLKSGPDQAIFCETTSVRLFSSGNHNNKVIVSMRNAVEDDIAIATVICPL